MESSASKIKPAINEDVQSIIDNIRMKNAQGNIFINLRANLKKEAGTSDIKIYI